MDIPVTLIGYNKQTFTKPTQLLTLVVHPSADSTQPVEPVAKITPTAVVSSILRWGTFGAPLSSAAFAGVFRFSGVPRCATIETWKMSR